MTDKKVPVHAELIKQWADGAIIQWYSDNQSKWLDCSNNLPTWSPQFEYRIKPEPKPDVVVYGKLIIDESSNFCYRIIGVTKSNDVKFDNIMLVFDGETGKLKDAQVLASSGE